MSEIDQHLRIVEAILFASTSPVSATMLAERLPEDTDVAALIENLRTFYAPRGVNLVSIGNGWALRTAGDLAPRLRSYARVARKLSRAAIETLAIIAYHQPVTRAEIEEVRGVSLSRGTLDLLFEAGWIHPKGRRRSPGRPITWGTTEAFLDHFGLESLKDLPGVSELKAAGLLDREAGLTAYRARGELTPMPGESLLPEDETSGDDENALPLAPEGREGAPEAGE